MTTKLEKALKREVEVAGEPYTVTLTPEGLRIELLETETGTFFDVGSPAPNVNGKELLSLLAHELGKLPNNLSIEGHTDAKPYTRGRDYGNWELSTDRANASRRENFSRPLPIIVNAEAMLIVISIMPAIVPTPKTNR